MIARLLGVSPSTVSLWVRDVELTEEQVVELYAYRRGARELGWIKRSEKARARREEAQADGRALAAEPDFVAGCMLYWAEGAKSRNRLNLVNADPEMLRYWVAWVQRWFGVEPSELVVRVNCHLGNGKTLEEIERWWLDTLDLPDSCLRRSIVNRVSSASKRKRPPLVHGTVSVALNSTAAVQAVYGAIQQFAGFDRPGWLNLPA